MREQRAANPLDHIVRAGEHMAVHLEADVLAFVSESMEEIGVALDGKDVVGTRGDR